VGDTFNHRIRMISPNGSVSTLAGNGMAAWADGYGTDASFNYPEGVAVGGNGYVYVADNYNHRIRMISPGGEVRTLAGCGTGSFADGFGTYACFYAPYDVAVDVNDTVYVADNWNQRIRKISADGLVSTLAGSGGIGFADGQGTFSSFQYPETVAVDHLGTVYVGDNNCIRKITAAGVVSTLAGNGGASFNDGVGSGASFNEPAGIAVDPSGLLYISDAHNQRIRIVSPAGVVSTLAGNSNAAYADGPGTAASFYFPQGIAVLNSVVYVAEYGNNRIRQIT